MKLLILKSMIFMYLNIPNKKHKRQGRQSFGKRGNTKVKPCVNVQNRKSPAKNVECKIGREEDSCK